MLRNGRRVGALPTSAVTPDQLVELIAGSLPQPHAHSHRRAATDAVLELKGACGGLVGPLDFAVAAGEVFGVVGLRGAGQGQVALWLSGQLQLVRGTITLAGQPFDPGPRAALAAGAALVTGNRETTGMAASMTVHENLLLNPCAPWAERLPAALAAQRACGSACAGRAIRRPPTQAGASYCPRYRAATKQKVILARSLDLDKPLVVLEDPTVGVDVGARAAIFELVRQATEAGACVVLVRASSGRSRDRATVPRRSTTAASSASSRAPR